MGHELQHGYGVFRIRAADGSAEACVVPELGGIVSSLRLPGPGGLQEVLFQHPFFWETHAERTRGGLPFLFPTCGRLERNGQPGAYLYDGLVYQMTIHGFGMRLPWSVRKADASSVTLVLHDTDATRVQYPFAFEVALTYRVLPGRLLIEQEYRNPGRVPLPYYAGFHPYFLTPAAGAGKDKVRINFRAVSRLFYNERLTDVVGRGAAPALPAGVSDAALHECLAEVRDNKEVELQFPGGLVLHIAADGVEDHDMFPYVQLYTAAEQPFFCVEPWMGFPNALNTVRGCRLLAPGHAERGVLRVWTSAIE
jgi:galactose mutarotase-like enzyme